jgi:DNA polymerase-3 subunit beta
MPRAATKTEPTTTRAMLPTRRLQEVVSAAAQVAAKRDTANPSLKCLHLEVRDQVLRVSATDLEADVTYEIPCDITGPAGRWLVPAAQAAPFIARLPGELAELEFRDVNVTVTAGPACASISTGTLDMYPDLPEVRDSALTVKVPACDLREALRVRYAAAGEDFRAIFRGVQFEFTTARARLAATDGFRLALVNLPNTEGTLPQKVCINARHLKPLVHLLDHATGEAHIGITHGTLHVMAGSGIVSLKMLDGELPDYERVIPSHLPVRATLDRGQVIAALARLTPFSSSLTSDRVDLSIHGDKVRVLVESDTGRAQEDITAAIQGTDPVALGFRRKQLTELLAHATSQEVTLELPPSMGQPMLVQDDSYTAVVVTLRA